LEFLVSNPPHREFNLEHQDRRRLIPLPRYIEVSIQIVRVNYY